MQDKSGADSKPDPKYIQQYIAERSRACNAMVYTFPARERERERNFSNTKSLSE